jgi:Bacterial Ig-like domain (group 3)/FG-GAP-like repeat
MPGKRNPLPVLSTLTLTLWLFGASLGSAGGFTAYANYSAGTSPHSVAVGDFNGDGVPDLVVANYGSNSVSVLLGKGNGSFGNATDYAAGAYPISVAVGDFNKDGFLDVAVADNNNNQAPGSLSILLGKGDGTLQAPVSYGSQGSPYFVAVADLNGDGILDAVVANHGAEVAVYLGNGNGTFAPAEFYPAGGNPQSVAIADFNGDSVPDLAVANSLSNDISILIGRGDGSFLAPRNYTTGSAPSVVVTADFNGDGHLDLAVPNNGSNTISILLGNGNGSFQPQYTISTGSRPSGLATADFNGDSIADLAVTNQSGASETVAVFLGVGNGTFQNPTAYKAGNQPRIMVATDLNGDGAADMAVACSQGGVNVFLNTGGTRVAESSAPNPSKVGQSVSFATQVSASIPGSGTPSGTVSYYDGSALLGTGTLGATGKTSFKTSGLSEGTHSIVEVYSGDSSFNPHTAPPIIQVVNAP